MRICRYVVDLIVVSIGYGLRRFGRGFRFVELTWMGNLFECEFYCGFYCYDLYLLIFVEFVACLCFVVFVSCLF